MPRPNSPPAAFPVSTFTLATNRRWKDQQSGEWKEETDWHNCVMWRTENLANYLLKGKQIYVEGRLQTRSYDDKEGQKKYITEVVCEAQNLILLGGGAAAATLPRRARAIMTGPCPCPAPHSARKPHPLRSRPTISIRASPTTTFRSNSALFSGPAATPLASRGLRCGLGLTELLQQFWRASPARGLGLKSFEAEDGCVQV